MAWQSSLVAFDLLHHHHHHQHDPASRIQQRELHGKVFGVELPAWIIFHAMLGYILLGIGLTTITLRLPLKLVRRWRWLHPYLGYTWVFGTVWMPVTAIWCVYSFTGWDVIAFFIFSMYAAIQLGWLLIRTYCDHVVKQAPEPLSMTSTQPLSLSWKTKLFKTAHGSLMVYSFIMLLGAGISFPFRSVNQYASTH